MEDTEFVTDRQWDNQARRIFKKNIRDHGQSLSESGIARRANSYIVDSRPDEKGMIVKSGWREAMKEAMTDKELKAAEAIADNLIDSIENREKYAQKEIPLLAPDPEDVLKLSKAFKHLLAESNPAKK